MRVAFVNQTYLDDRETSAADHPASKVSLDLPSAKGSTCIAIFRHYLDIALVLLLHRRFILARSRFDSGDIYHTW